MSSTGNSCKMFYEEDSDLMVKLRPYVTGDRIDIPMSNVLSRKWYKVIDTDMPEASAVANPFLDAYMHGSNAFVLLIIADVLHNLKLSVSFEMFKTETGFDPFDTDNHPWATAEINKLRCVAGGEEVTALIEPLIWSLTDLQMNNRGTTDRNQVVEDVWDMLDLNPDTILLRSLRTEIQEPILVPQDDQNTRQSRRSTTPKKKIPLYKRVSSVDLMGACDRD